MGLDAIGRPNNLTGAADLAEWITKNVPLWRRDIVILGENDRKEDGTFPGLDGARRVSQQLANILSITVRWAMPPMGMKDVRAWFEAEAVKKGRTDRGCGFLFSDAVSQGMHPAFPGHDLPPFTPPWALAGEAQQDEKSHQQTEEEKAAEEALLNKIDEVIVNAKQVKESMRETEAKMAQVIAKARADHEREHGMRCGRPRSVVLHDLATNGPRVQFVRCENYHHCQGCRRWRIFRETANATLHFHGHANAGGQLYELNVAAEQWDAMRRRINRQGGQYHRTHEDCEGSLYYVVVSVRVPGSIPVRPDVAVSTVRHLLDEYDGQPRPVATSHGWKLPRTEERADRYRRVGMGSRWLSLYLLRQIADELGCHVGLSVGDDQQSRCVVACDLVMRTWSDADRDYAFDCLMSGEVLYIAARCPRSPIPGMKTLRIYYRTNGTGIESEHANDDQGHLRERPQRRVGRLRPQEHHRTADTPLGRRVLRRWPKRERIQEAHRIHRPRRPPPVGHHRGTQARNLAGLSWQPPTACGELESKHPPLPHEEGRPHQPTDYAGSSVTPARYSRPDPSVFPFYDASPRHQSTGEAPSPISHQPPHWYDSCSCAAPLRMPPMPRAARSHSRCPQNGKADRRPSSAARGYDWRWRQFSAVYLARNPLCVACHHKGRTTPASCVDHVKALEQGGEKYDEGNLQALCHPCHSAKTVSCDGGFGRQKKG
jgi:5-methylcytosine-specific restriction protein A